MVKDDSKKIIKGNRGARKDDNKDYANILFFLNSPLFSLAHSQ